MHAIIILGMMASANGDCTLDSGSALWSSAVEDAMTSTLNIWAASKRCTGTLLEEAGVKCEQDVTAAIESVIALANDIAAMVSECADLKYENEDCVSLVTDLVSQTAGLASDGGALANHCGHIVPERLDNDILGKLTTLGMCTVDTGGAMNSLFKASGVIKHVKNNCGEKSSEGSCATSSLNVLSVISNLGSYISQSVADCHQYSEIVAHHKDDLVNEDLSMCATAVLHSIADLSGVAQIALQLKDVCQVSDARLFIENGSKEATKPAGMNPIVLGSLAMVPITAALSFAAGKRLAKTRQEVHAFNLESQEDTLSAE